MGEPIAHHHTAGGVVLDDQNRVLVLERDVVRGGRAIHEVRLPKGHVDPGETDEQAALREVWEESGYSRLRIVADLGLDESEFEHYGCRNHRVEHYYLMRLTGNHRETPAVDPDSEEALFTPAWLTLQEAEARLTYPSEQRFARRAFEWLRTGS